MAMLLGNLHKKKLEHRTSGLTLGCFWMTGLLFRCLEAYALLVTAVDRALGVGTKMERKENKIYTVRRHNGSL